MVTPASAAHAPIRNPAGLRAIDVEVPAQMVNWDEIARSAPSGLPHRIPRQGGAPLACHGFKFVADRFV